VILGLWGDIEASPEVVWSYVSDPEKLRKWHGGIRAIVPISAGMVRGVTVEGEVRVSRKGEQLSGRGYGVRKA
jgi:uncharacterized protein YndB with AHSA1/START domain